MRKVFQAIPLSLAIAIVSIAAQQPSNEPKTKPQEQKAKCPMHNAHSRMSERGEQGMGFSQTTTTHHFLLKSDGGTIQVEANSPDDNGNRDNIRMHLTHI